MARIQETDEENQLILKSKANSFYTTNILHYEP